MLWLKSECVTVMDGLVVRWKMPNATMEISASRNGVMLQGATPALSSEDTIDFVKQIQAAHTIVSRIMSGSYVRDKGASSPFPRGEWVGRAVRTGECVNVAT